MFYRSKLLLFITGSKVAIKIKEIFQSSFYLKIFILTLSRHDKQRYLQTLPKSTKTE